MKTLIFTTIALVSLAGSLRAADNTNWANVKPATVLKVISLFKADPGGTNAPGAMSIIMNFAQASTNVDVEINPAYLPWFSKQPKLKNSEILAAAFVAGNIQAQLEKHANQDHPADGILFMCDVYKSLRKKNQIDPIPELEEWSKLDSDGVKALVTKNKHKDGQKAGSANGSQPARSETNRTPAAAGSTR